MQRKRFFLCPGLAIRLLFLHLQAIAEAKILEPVTNFPVLGYGKLVQEAIGKDKMFHGHPAHLRQRHVSFRLSADGPRFGLFRLRQIV